MTLRLNRARAASKAEDTTQDPAEENKDEKDVKGKSKAKAEGEEKKEEGETEGKGASAKPLTGAAAERARFKGILGAKHADGFSNLAMHLASETDLSAEQAAGILAAAMQDVSTDASAEPSAAKPSDRSKEFEAAMRNDAKNPDLGTGGGGGGSGRDAQEDELLKALRAKGLHRDSKD